MVNIKPPDSDVALAYRQEQMIPGLLALGLSLERIKDLGWYDPRLEKHYTGVYKYVPVDIVDTETVHLDIPPADVDAAEKRKAYKREWMAKKRAGTPVSEI